MSESNLIGKIMLRLPEELGEKFEVSLRPRATLSQRINIKGEPDLVVLNRDTGKVTLLEIKGSTTTSNLPLAVVPETQKIMEENQDIDAKVILISTSNVIEPIRARLKNLNIPLIESNQEDTILTELKNYIRGF
jgi:hypothetical protein